MTEMTQKRARVQHVLLQIFRDQYAQEPGTPDAELLRLNPNDFDLDPAGFYETVVEVFGDVRDPRSNYFSGLGGTLTKLVDAVTARWDGVTLNPTRWRDYSK